MVGREAVGQVRRDRHVVGRVERDEVDGDIRREHGLDRGRVGEGVPLERVAGCMSVDEDVARGVDRAEHRVDAGDPVGQGRVGGEGVLEVGQRPEGDDGRGARTVIDGGPQDFDGIARDARDRPAA